MFIANNPPTAVTFTVTNPENMVKLHIVETPTDLETTTVEIRFLGPNGLITTYTILFSDAGELLLMTEHDDYITLLEPEQLAG